MRINKYVASATGLSRRAADQAILEGRVAINSQAASLGDSVADNDTVTLDRQPITPAVNSLTIMLNKPAGYVCSRNGQGSPTIYDLLPPEYRQLKPIGRLDKDSTGLLLLTNDGQLANRLTHPRYAKTKAYEVSLDKPLEPLHQQMISDHGIQIQDYVSRLMLQNLDDSRFNWQISMSQGRNRQIRRTFDALGYTVTKLHRTNFGDYKLNDLASGSFATTTQLG